MAAKKNPEGVEREITNQESGRMQDAGPKRRLGPAGSNDKAPRPNSGGINEPTKGM